MSEQAITQVKPQTISAMPTASSHGILQRCSNGVECEDCRKKREATLQRAAVNTSPTNDVPPIVQDVLRSPGQSLDRGTRTFMESRFGHDFSGVRVHTDGRAAESAQSVNALAYTVGRDVVFGAGQYSPTTMAGKRLLAHELTHTIQQGTETKSLRHSLQIGSTETWQEREAEEVTQHITTGKKADAIHSDREVLRRQEAIPVDLTPASPQEQKELEKRDIHLPTVSDETWRSIGGVSDNAGKPLSEAEIKAIKLAQPDLSTSSPLASIEGPKFLLHDTSSLVSASTIESEKRQGRGPLGKGVSAYVPQSGDATIARPNFYETNRPTTTEYEKASDIIKEAPREKEFRQVWSATAPTERTNALDRAHDGLGLSPTEITSEKKKAQDELNASSGKIFTSASWTIREICHKIGQTGVKGVALPAKEEDLTHACTTLAPYFTTREARVGSLVTVEIVQAGVKSEKGSQNTCDPKNPNIAQMPSPPYSDSQYSEIVKLYLRASLLARRFPEITTHFQVDAFERGHCDPRCFDLQKLYNSIALSLGHGKGSTYGIKPSYGTQWGTNTIWWDNKICGGSPPS